MGRSLGIAGLGTVLQGSLTGHNQGVSWSINIARVSLVRRYSRLIQEVLISHCFCLPCVPCMWVSCFIDVATVLFYN